MKKQLIAIIGGPGTGKSTLLKELEDKGYCCYPEISREITLEAKKQGIDQLFLENPLIFSELLLKKRIQQFRDAAAAGANMIFIDRGIPDVAAYLEYKNINIPENFLKASINYRYNHVFVLPPWPEIYQSDNERYESFEQALEIQQQLLQTYERFRYIPIEIPKNSPSKRADFIIDYLS